MKTFEYMELETHIGPELTGQLNVLGKQGWETWHMFTIPELVHLRAHVFLKREILPEPTVVSLDNDTHDVLAKAVSEALAKNKEQKNQPRPPRSKDRLSGV